MEEKKKWWGMVLWIGLHVSYKVVNFDIYLTFVPGRRRGSVDVGLIETAAEMLSTCSSGYAAHMTSLYTQCSSLSFSSRK